MDRTFFDAFFGAKPIWLADGGQDDEYADFLTSYELTPGHNYVLRISADTDYAVYAGSVLCGFGQYSDYPGRAIYDDIPLPDNGEILKITAWHSGINASTHIRHKAYAVFCLLSDGKPVLLSDTDIRSTFCPGYVQHKPFLITGQLGAGFSLISGADAAEAKESVIAEEAFDTALPRPNHKLVLGEEYLPKTVKTGTYQLAESEEPAWTMQHSSFDGETCDGTYAIYDLGAETVGFPHLIVSSPAPCKVLVGWGEHLTDGRCRTWVGGRRFVFTWEIPAGTFEVFPPLRRIGCRYLQIFLPHEAQVLHVGFTPVLYPAEATPSSLTGLRKNIRDTAIHTLRCCMHEHYEDCPWREQSLYTLDSRNQMLAGYHAFADGNREMARASLDLISRGVRKDGILSLCYPAGTDAPIPMYSLAYFIQMDEYLRETGDDTLAREKIGMLRTLLSVFLNRRTDRGLVRRFPASAGYWNYYEWSPTMDGTQGYSGVPEDALPCEAPLNAFLSLACRAMASICSTIGEKDADFYRETAESIAQAIYEELYQKDEKLFATFPDTLFTEKRSVLTQALCLLCGAADRLSASEKEKMLRVTAENGGDDTIPATLSMACFRYDALLRENQAAYGDLILHEIDACGKLMLDRGATTFWETIVGEADFGGAGSLCHGWSAMAIVYYDLLIRK